MTQTDISRMDFGQLRIAVQDMSEELYKLKRLLNESLYDLGNENFSMNIRKEKDMMKTAIKMNAEEIQFVAEDSGAKYAELTVRADEIESTVGTFDGRITTVEQTADGLETRVENAEGNITTISVTTAGLSSSVSSLNGEFNTVFTQTSTGFELSGDVKIEGNTYISAKDSYGNYSKITSNGLEFLDSSNQREGWAIIPNSSYGGVLKYYVNNSEAFSFGEGYSSSEYSNSDLVLKAANGSRGRFVVDITNSGYKEVKFVGLNVNLTDSTSPYIYANEQLLATQDWVQNHGGIAKFG